jgi:putative membrane protein
MELIKLAGIGLVLGITTIIPGLSVGTMAVALNVYDRLIGVITPNVKKIIAAWKFLLPLVIGGVMGIIVFSKVVVLLFEQHPVPTYWFFMGVIAGSIPLVYRRVRRPSSMLPSLPAVLCALCALAVMVIMTVFRPSEETAVYTDLTPPLFGILVAGGALAAVAMIIPGISGTFLLLIIGLYRTLVQAVADLHFSLLIPVVIGAVIGLIIGAALVRFLLAKAPTETCGAVLGLVTGSIVALYPGGWGAGAALFLSLGSMLAGGAISFMLGRRS